MARSMGSQGDEEGGKRLVPPLRAYLPQSIWARLHPHGCRLAHPDGFGAKDFQGEAWPRWASARRRPLREGDRAQVEGPFWAGDGAPTLVWAPAPAPAAPGTAEPEREGEAERGCSSLCPHEGARAPPGPRCSSEASRGGSGKAPKAQAPGRGRGRMEA